MCIRDSSDFVAGDAVLAVHLQLERGNVDAFERILAPLLVQLELDPGGHGSEQALLAVVGVEHLALVQVVDVLFALSLIHI